MYVRCAMMEDHREWEKARQVVEAIAKIMCGDGGDEPTPENPVTETSSTSSAGGVRTQTKVRKVLNVDYERRVQELIKNSRKVDAEGAVALAKLKSEWAEQGHG